MQPTWRGGAAIIVYKGCVAACAQPSPQLSVPSAAAPATQIQACEQARMVKLNPTVDPVMNHS
eukprot:5986070-Amphidinium_carterae.1